jgi:UDPglucose 6-dehydrogenase
MMKIGIMGNGFVGNATSLFKSNNVDVIVYDKDPNRCDPASVSLQDLSDCDLVLICVPTPMNKDGSCHTVIVESCVYELNMASIRDESIVVRSTVPVGFCESLGVNFMPEFLTEANWVEDFKNNNAWIFGADSIYNTSIKSKFKELISLSKASGVIKNDDIFFCPSKEAELIKLARNSFLATKVSFFNEIHDFCSKEEVDYNTVAELTGMDPRIGRSHTQVPGPDGKKGFGGTCFPKDISSLYHQMNQVGMNSYIVEAAKARNLQVDRRDQDWKLDKGRAVI